MLIFRILFLLTISGLVWAKPVTFSWDNQPSWPPGTTVELEANGVLSQGNTGTSVILDIPMQNYINVKARAVPDGVALCYSSGDCMVEGCAQEPCQPSSYSILTAYQPNTPINVWAQKTWIGVSAVATDNFNRADESPLAGNWSHSTGGGQLKLVNNEIAGTVTQADTFAYWNAQSFNADQYSEYTITSTNGAIDAGPAVRVSNTQKTGYFITTWQGNLRFYKYINGSGSGIGSNFGTVTTGDVVRLEVEGTTLRAYKNGVLQSTTTDTQISTGSPGIYGFSTTFTLDNWSGGDLITSTNLDGAAKSIASSTGTSSLNIPIVASALAHTQATGAIGIPINLSGTAASISSDSGILSIGLAISGDAIAKALDTANSSVQIPITGTGLSRSVSSGTISLQDPVTANALSRATTTGTITVQEALTALAASSAQASGTLSSINDVNLSGTAQALESSSGTLSVTDALAGAGKAIASDNGTLTVAVTLSGNSLSKALSTGAISVAGQVNLSASAVANANANSNLLVSAIPVSGTAKALAINTANPILDLPISSTAISLANATGDITVMTNIALSGQALSKAISSGVLGINIPLDNAGFAGAIASAFGIMSENISLSAQAVAKSLATANLFIGQIPVILSTLPARPNTIILDKRGDIYGFS